MGIHQLLHSSCCFLNTNTLLIRHLIGTTRTLEAEWWEVCGETCVWGQRKMSQVMGTFGLLDFTMLWPVVTWRAFGNLWTIYFFNFPNFFRAAVNRGYWILRFGGPPVLYFALFSTLALIKIFVQTNKVTFLKSPPVLEVCNSEGTHRLSTCLPLPHEVTQQTVMVLTTSIILHLIMQLMLKEAIHFLRLFCGS